MKKTDYYVFLMRLIRESKLLLCYWIKVYYLILRDLTKLNKYFVGTF